MGLSGPIGGGAAALGGVLGNATAECGPSIPDSQWAAKRLASLMSPESVASFRRNARLNARVLDPDIAAMLSISPARAYQMQVDREFARIIEQEKSWLERRVEGLLS